MAERDQWRVLLGFTPSGSITGIHPVEAIMNVTSIVM